MVQSTGMRSDTAMQPTISGLPTTAGTAKRLLSHLVVTREYKRPQDPIPNGMRPIELAPRRRSDQRFRW